MRKPDWKRPLAAVLIGLLMTPVLPWPTKVEAAPGPTPKSRPYGDMGKPGRPILSRSDRAQVIPHPYVPGEVIVRFKKPAGIAEAASVKSLFGLNTKSRFPEAGTELMRIENQDSVEQVIASLKASGTVELAQPNYIYRVSDVSDPDWNVLWGLHNTGADILGKPGVDDIDIDAPEAWAYTENLADVVVAVIDTGVDINHPDLAGKIWVNPGEIPGNGIDDDHNGLVDDVNGWDFANNDKTVFDPFPLNTDEHGTHVAGTIAAAADTFGIRGVTQNVKIMPLKFIGPDGGTTENAIKAIHYAHSKGVSVSNNSWGGASFDPALNEAIQTSNMVFVAAAGNDGQDNDAIPHWPSAYPADNIITVAAVNNRGELAKFGPQYGSNYGATTVDVGAPGHSIYSTIPKGFGGYGTAIQVSSTYKSMLWGFGLQEMEFVAQRSSAMQKTLSVLGLTPSKHILLVDDDESDVGYPDVGPVYAGVLNDLGYTNVTTHIVPQGADGPTASIMATYDGVIWFTGLGFGDGNATLTTGDQSAIQTYLGGSNKAFFLSGEDATFGIRNSSLLNNTLKTYLVGEYGQTPLVQGISGTVYQGESYKFQYPNQYRDLLDVYDPADPTAKIAMETLDALDYNWAYQFMSGTSMAAPHVSGIAATVMAQKNLTPQEAIGLIKESGVTLPSLVGKTVSGKMVNLHNAVATQVLTPTVTMGSATPSVASTYSVNFQVGAYGKLTPAKGSITITFPAGTTLPASIGADQIKVNGTPVGAAGAAVTPLGQAVTFTVPITIPHGATAQVDIGAGANILSPTAGTYKLAVHTNTDPVPVDSTTYSLSLTPTLQFDAAGYRGFGSENVTWDGADTSRKARRAQLTLTGVASLIGVGSVSATVTSDTDPTGIQVTLTETALNSGTFTGSLGFTSQAASDDGADLLKVSSGSATITATVTAGGPPVDVIGTAGWQPANVTRSEIRGVISFPAGTYPNEITVDVYRDGQRFSAGSAEGLSVGPGGALHYSVFVAAGDSGTYRVVAYAPGKAAQTAAILVTATPTGVVEGDLVAPDWYDTYVLDQGTMALAQDIGAPNAPSVTSPSPGFVGQTSVLVSGVTEPLAMVSINLDGGAPQVLQANEAGNFSHPLAGMSEGNHTLIIRVADFAGNISTDTTIAFTVDTLTPAKPVVPRLDANDTTVFGVTEANSTVVVQNGPITLGIGQAGPTGFFTVTISSAQAEGIVLSVVATDGAGHISEVASITVTAASADTTPPLGPNVDPVGDADTVVTGTAEGLASVRVFAGPTILGEGPAAAVTGVFSVTIPRQTLGTILTVIAVDDANNSSPAAPVTVVDRTGPAAPTVLLVDHLSTVVKGSAEPGATVKVEAGGTLLDTATAGVDGLFSVPIPVQAIGTVLTVTAVDASLNPSPATTITVVEHDSTPPSAPTVNPVGDSDVTLTGTAESDATVSIKAGTTTLGTAKADGGGAFTVPIPKQSSGTVLTVKATDPSGNDSPATVVTVLDLTAPAIFDVDPVSDTDTVVTGKSEAGALIVVMKGSTTLGTATVGPGGTFSVTIPRQFGGTILWVYASDAAGNVSYEWGLQVIDTLPPDAPTVSPVRDNDTTVSGFAEPEATVLVFKGTQMLGQQMTNEDGTFRVGIPRQNVGTVLTVKVRDSAWVVGPGSNVTVQSATPGGGGGGSGGGGGGMPLPPPDTTPPLAPSVDEVGDRDTSVKGTAEESATITVKAGDATLGSSETVSGHFSITIPPQKAGTILTITATDKAKNASPSTTVTVKDKTPPKSPSVGELDDTMTTLTGSAESGARVQVSVGGTEIGTATADQSGHFSLTIPKQKAGTALSIVATDAAGNASPATTVTVSKAGVTPSERGVRTVGLLANGKGQLTETLSNVDLNGLTGDLVVTLTQSTVTIGSGSGAQTVPLAKIVFEIPASLIRALAGRGTAIDLRTEFGSIRIPPGVLASLITGDQSLVRISIQIIDMAAGSTWGHGFAPTGRVLSLTAEVVDGQGRAKIVTSFAQPLTVRLPFAFAATPAHLGVYRLNEVTGAWEYRGGVVDPAGQTVTVQLSGFSQYTVLEYTKRFADMEGHWANTDVALMTARHVVSGTSETDFTPEGSVTRGQFAAMLTRALGLSPYEGTSATFHDVSTNDWFFGGVEAAVRVGLITGSEGLFRPIDLVTRQEMAVMLGRALALRGKGDKLTAPEVDGLVSGLGDGAEVQGWAKAAVAQALHLKLLTGRSKGAFAPTANASRAEAVVVLKRLLQQLGEV